MSEKKQYEKPELKSEEILERVALACSKVPGGCSTKAGLETS